MAEWQNIMLISMLCRPPLRSRLEQGPDPVVDPVLDALTTVPDGVSHLLLLQRGVPSGVVAQDLSWQLAHRH